MKIFLMIIGIIFFIGCAPATKQLSDYERANKAVFYRTQTERELRDLRQSTAVNDELRGQLEQANRLLLIATDNLMEE